MKTFVGKYSLEILTFIMFTFVVMATIFVPDLSTTQKILIAYMFLFTLHEWEEKKYPGGFADLMIKLIGINPDKSAIERSNIPVLILLLLITIVPYFFDSTIILVLIPVFLGFFEGFVHIAGIKLHKMKKPYTPGMITAICLLLMSCYAVYYFYSNNMASGLDYLLGFICMFVSFAIMQNRVLASLGLGYKNMAAAMKKRLKG